MSEFICPIKCDSFGCDEELCQRYKAYEQGKTDGARKFAKKIKSEIKEYWYRSELDMGAENVNSLIDDVLAEWQKEKAKCQEKN